MDEMDMDRGRDSDGEEVQVLSPEEVRKQAALNVLNLARGDLQQGLDCLSQSTTLADTLASPPSEGADLSVLLQTLMPAIFKVEDDSSARADCARNAEGVVSAFKLLLRSFDAILAEGQQGQAPQVVGLELPVEPGRDISGLILTKEQLNSLLAELRGSFFFYLSHETDGPGSLANTCGGREEGDDLKGLFDCCDSLYSMGEMLVGIFDE